MLLDTGKVDMAAEDVCGLTASQFAYFNHHTRIDDLLLARGGGRLYLTFMAYRFYSPNPQVLSDIMLSTWFMIFQDYSMLGSF